MRNVIVFAAFVVTLSTAGQSEAQNYIETNCAKYGRTGSPSLSCSSGRDLYGGLCYKSCSSGWRRTAACTCVKRTCSSNCWDRPYTDCGRYSSVFRKSCPSGWKRTAVCTCVKKECNNTCWDKPWTDCGRFGLGSNRSPKRTCPGGTQLYAGGCHRSCPVGWVRTAACSCEQKDWKKTVANQVATDVSRVVRDTGTGLANAYKTVSGASSAAALRAKATIEREAQKVVSVVVQNPERKLRALFGGAIKGATALAKKKIQAQWAQIARMKGVNKTVIKNKLRMSAKTFRKQFTASRMRSLASGRPAKAAMKRAATRSLKLSGAMLVAEAAATAAGVPAWAAIKCSDKTGAAYETCFHREAVAATRFALFDVMLSVAFAPIDLQIIVPGAVKLAALITAAATLAGGPVLGATLGTFVAIISKLTVTALVLYYAEKLFKYYDQYLWKGGILREMSALYKSQAKQAARNLGGVRITTTGLGGGGSSTTGGTSCPTTHPYPYGLGAYCCNRTPKTFGWQNTNGRRGQDNGTCPGSYRKCSGSQCTKPHSSCPASHPYPYGHGTYCCRSFPINKRYRTYAGRRGWTFDNCKANKYLKCPTGNCGRTAP